MDERTKKAIIDLIQRGEELPEEYSEVLSPTTKKEYELKYAGKTREQTILNDTMSVPFQAVKHFGRTKEGEWANMLIFGDNLQALKHLLKLKNEGKLRNPDGTDGVKLVYIDPPFATKQDFQGNQGQQAYQDKLLGAEFIEFLRKRLILLRELLTDDGSIYVHLDSKKGHYVKIIMDEIFGAENFRNEILWYYYNKMHDSRKGMFPNATDFIYFYVKDRNADYTFCQLKEDRDTPVKQLVRKKVDGKMINARDEEGNVMYQIATDRTVDNVWRIAMLQPAGRDEPMRYPTQKPERLLDRVIQASSKEGDIVLDCFAGAGTTAVVSEKRKRRWIQIDCGKLALYTIQQRMMELHEEIGNKGASLKHKPFTLYHAGLYYDGELLQQMRSDEYKEFVLELFGCQKRDHKINGLDMHGTLNNHSVMVFDKEHFLTKEFVEDLHKNLGSSIKDSLYLIAPVGVVGFNEDYVKCDEKKYVVLRIPNSIIAHIREQNFTKLKQPRSANDINQTIDAVGFDFIYPPKVKAKYFVEKPKGRLTDKEYGIEIQEFEPTQIGTNIVEYKDANDAREKSLAMVMVDLDYNGETFNLGRYFFGDKIAENNYKIQWDNEIGEKVMVIFLDIFGNEKKEVLTKSDFTLK